MVWGELAWFQIYEFTDLRIDEFGTSQNSTIRPSYIRKLLVVGRKVPGPTICTSFSQDDRQTCPVFEHQRQLLFLPAQGFEHHRVPAQTSPDRGRQRRTLFDERIPDMRQSDGITSQQHAVTVAISFHPGSEG